jgi:hypothetical protein
MVLSLVLILTAAPEAALLCQAWCHPPATVACHHEGPSAASSVITGADPCHDCDHAGAAAVQCLREHVRRGEAAGDAGPAIVVSRYQLACSTIDVRRGDELARAWSFEGRQLSVILRL